MTNGRKSLEWIAVDWGTTNLRAWLIAKDGTIIGTCRSDLGMARVKPDDFEAALLDLVSDALKEDEAVPVVVCGMAGARQGWKEAPYLAVPCPAPGLRHAVKPAMQDKRLQVHILPGLMQSEPADVMRGEETQIAGYLAERPNFEGVICLPGTHTKWVEVTGNTITGFKTFMTGEVFGLLSSQSVLRHSVSNDGLDEGAFLSALEATLENPNRVASGLFSIRSKALLNNVAGTTLRSELSGYLLGLELGNVRQDLMNKETVLIGEARLVQLYRIGLKLLGANAISANSEDITLSGLKHAYAELQG